MKRLIHAWIDGFENIHNFAAKMQKRNLSSIITTAHEKI